MKARKITLLETTPAYRGFLDLSNFRRTRFNEVFRSEELPSPPPPPPPPTNNYVPVAPRAAPPAMLPVTNSIPFRSSKNSSPDGTPRQAVVSPAANTPPLSVTSEDPSWGKLHSCDSSQPAPSPDHRSATAHVLGRMTCFKACTLTDMIVSNRRQDQWEIRNQEHYLDRTQ